MHSGMKIWTHVIEERDGAVQSGHIISPDGSPAPTNTTLTATSECAEYQVLVASPRQLHGWLAGWLGAWRGGSLARWWAGLLDGWVGGWVGGLLAA